MPSAVLNDLCYGEYELPVRQDQFTLAHELRGTPYENDGPSTPTATNILNNRFPGFKTAHFPTCGFAE